METKYVVFLQMTHYIFVRKTLFRLAMAQDRFLSVWLIRQIYEVPLLFILVALLQAKGERHPWWTYSVAINVVRSWVLHDPFYNEPYGPVR